MQKGAREDKTDKTGPVFTAPSQGASQPARVTGWPPEHADTKSHAASSGMYPSMFQKMSDLSEILEASHLPWARAASDALTSALGSSLAIGAYDHLCQPPRVTASTTLQAENSAALVQARRLFSTKDKSLFEALQAALADHGGRPSHEMRQMCILVTLRAVAKLEAYAGQGVYFAWHTLRTMRRAANCPALEWSFWVGMSTSNRHALFLLQECGIHSPRDMHSLLGTYGPLTEKHPPWVAALLETHRLVRCPLALENVVCTSYAAWKKYSHLDLHAAADLERPITGRIVWAHYARTHHPETHTDGNPLDEKHLLDVAHHWIPLHPTSQTYADFMQACFEHGWMMKAALANCPDVMPQQHLWALLARRGWRLKDRIGWALVAHQLWYPTLVKHLIMEVDIVGAALHRYERKMLEGKKPQQRKKKRHTWAARREHKKRSKSSA